MKGNGSRGFVRIRGNVFWGPWRVFAGWAWVWHTTSGSVKRVFQPYGVMMERDEQHEEPLDELSWEAREALEDPNGPQACDLVGQDADAAETVACPACGAAVY